MGYSTYIDRVRGLVRGAYDAIAARAGSAVSRLRLRGVGSAVGDVACWACAILMLISAIPLLIWIITPTDHRGLTLADGDLERHPAYYANRFTGPQHPYPRIVIAGLVFGDRHESYAREWTCLSMVKVKPASVVKEPVKRAKSKRS